MERELVRADLDRSQVLRSKAIALPGAYNPRPRQWDLVVVDDGVPVAAVDVRISTCPSGKNFHNRVQEIIEDAVHLGRPYEFPLMTPFKPCLALFFALEENEDANRLRKIHPAGLASGLGAGDGASIKDRHSAVFGRLVRDGRYDAICYLAVTRSSDPVVTEPKATLGFADFARSVVGRIAEIRQHTADNPVDRA